MADFKKLNDEKMRLQQRISKAKKELTEAEARLAFVNKEIEEDSLNLADRTKKRQA